MIQILADMPAGVLGFAARGKLTADDYRDILAPAIDAASADGGRVRIVYVFEGRFDGMDAGALWQDLKMGVRDWKAWDRIALVTDQDWLRDGLKAFAWAVPGEARAFTLEERDAAIAWAAADDGPG